MNFLNITECVSERLNVSSKIKKARPSEFEEHVTMQACRANARHLRLLGAVEKWDTSERLCVYTHAHGHGRGRDRTSVFVSVCARASACARKRERVRLCLCECKCAREED